MYILKVHCDLHHTVVMYFLLLNKYFYVQSTTGGPINCTFIVTISIITAIKLIIMHDTNNEL